MESSLIRVQLPSRKFYMNEVIPITITSVNWDMYLKYARTQLSRSVTESLDKAKRPLDTPAAFIITLAEAQGAELRPFTQLLSNAGGLLRHASAGFLFTADIETLLYIIEQSSLQCARWSNKKTMIVSGNMLAWRVAITNFCKPDVPKDVRDLFNKSLVCFEMAGFGPLWSDQQKTMSPDKTFLLTEK